jgi:uncharacterized protein (TIGR03792 family)
MFIERLSFQVNPEAEENFLKEDERIWTSWLRQQPGFLHKTLNKFGGNLIQFNIFWKDENANKKAAGKPDLKSVEARFRNALGPVYRRISI